MSFKQQNKTELLAKDVFDLFRCAVTEMETGQGLWRKKHYPEFIKTLHSSASSLSHALLAANGIAVPADSNIEARLKESLQAEKPDLSAQQVIAATLNILTFNYADENASKESVKALQALNSNYRNAIIHARRIIVHKLREDGNYPPSLIQKLLSRPVLKRLAGILLPLVLLITLPLAYYSYTQPVSVYKLDGQLFWKNKPGVPFDNKKSVHYAVIADNKIHEYSIELPAAENIFMLRLDPVNKAYLTEVEIESITLAGQNDDLRRTLLFDGSMYWSCDNCLDLQKTSGSYRMRPANSDLYLTSSPVNAERVKNIKLRMRAVSSKTFWQWLLNIDKSMEF